MKLSVLWPRPRPMWTLLTSTPDRSEFLLISQQLFTMIILVGQKNKVQMFRRRQCMLIKLPSSPALEASRESGEDHPALLMYYGCWSSQLDPPVRLYVLLTTLIIPSDCYHHPCTSGTNDPSMPQVCIQTDIKLPHSSVAAVPCA